MSKVYFNLASGSLLQDWSSSGLITTNDNWSGVPSIEGYLDHRADRGRVGDHRTDVLWERADGTLRIDDMNGPSIMSTTISGQIGSEWTLQGTADYDGNGTADVVWQRTSDGALHFYQMANNQVQQATTYGQVGLEWHLL